MKELGYRFGHGGIVAAVFFCTQTCTVFFVGYCVQISLDILQKCCFIIYKNDYLFLPQFVFGKMNGLIIVEDCL